MQLTCDKFRLRTADSVKVCHSASVHLRSKEYIQLTNTVFFLVWYGNARTFTGLLLNISSCLQMIHCNDISKLLKLARTQKMAAQQVTCCWRLQSLVHFYTYQTYQQRFDIMLWIFQCGAGDAVSFCSAVTSECLFTLYSL
jgi:hypothetical protein